MNNTTMKSKTQKEIEDEIAYKKKQEREAAERAAKIKRIQSEITDLEILLAQYQKFESDVSAASGSLSSLGGNLNNSATSLSQGIVLDGVGLGQDSLAVTSTVANNYATSLSSVMGEIDTKIKDIQLKIEQKKSELRLV